MTNDEIDEDWICWKDLVLSVTISISHDPKFGIPMLPHGLTAKLSVYLCRKKESARRKAINANIQQHWDKYKDFR